MLTILLICLSIFLLAVFLKHLNKDYDLLNLSKRVRTADGSKLEDKVHVTPGKTIFGNNFDILSMTPETIFNFFRSQKQISNRKGYLLRFLFSNVYNVTTAEGAEAIFQSQTLITKSVVYELIRPFLGDGLLISTNKKWHFRRKILTPTFHFNILQTFIEIFKEETYKLVASLETKVNQIVSLTDVIPAFTLNNVCETALGVKLDDIEGSVEYRKSIHILEVIMVKRSCNPLMFYPLFFNLFGESKVHRENLKIAHDFSSKIIKKKRIEYLKEKKSPEVEQDEFGKKKRYAMLDTLLDAEAKGLIKHEGICDEVNTFMFEGYDTTSMCLIFSLLNLALHADVQDKCFNEIKDLGNIADLTVFDFNKLDYLECVIKEVLRLYPSVPFASRQTEAETELNGIIFPKNSQINVHIYDILRDPRHFPNPSQFDPDRFLPENTTNRHPFAFVPFSAGPRNCIGQKFAMLEIKVLLVAIIQNFVLLPETQIEDIVLENGIILRTQKEVKIKLKKRL